MFTPPTPFAAPAGNRCWFPQVGRGGGWLVFAGLLCLAGPAAAGAEPEVAKEYQLKAAYLYNFTKFVEWPRERFADDTSPIVIAVLGENPFGDELARLVSGRKVNGRPITVLAARSVREGAAAHLLFISARDEKSLGPALAQLHAAGVLTVGESPGFAAGGGIITFILEADKVRFEINLTAAEQSRLKLSAQLLKLATVVRRQP